MCGARKSDAYIKLASAKYTQLDTTCNQVTILKLSLKTLEPDQTYQVELDLCKPRWHMLIKIVKVALVKKKLVLMTITRCFVLFIITKVRTFVAIAFSKRHLVWTIVQSYL